MKVWARIVPIVAGSDYVGSLWLERPDETDDEVRFIEIEIPDPPHEWKVGDWFRLPTRLPMRITDMADGIITWSGRNDRGEPRADWCQRGALDHATPCDPPDWWEGDR